MDDVFEPPHLQRIVHEALSGAVDRGVDNLHVAVTAVGLGRKTQSMDVMQELVVDILAYLLNKRFVGLELDLVHRCDVVHVLYGLHIMG